MIVSSRRRFLLGLSAGLAAPAIVRATSLMPVKLIDWNLDTMERSPYWTTMANLQAIVRRAYVPRLFVQVNLDNTAFAALGISSP